MSISGSQIALEVSKKYQAVFTGDGVTTTFTLSHNLNSDFVSFYARDVMDGMRAVILENYPEPLDPTNKLIVEFQFPPTALQSYKIQISG